VGLVGDPVKDDANERVAERIVERLNTSNDGELFVVIYAGDGDTDEAMNTDPDLGIMMSLLGPDHLEMIDEGDGVVAIYGYPGAR